MTRASILLQLTALVAVHAAGCYTGSPEHRCMSCDSYTNVTCQTECPSAACTWTEECCKALPPPYPPLPPVPPPPCQPDSGCYGISSTHTCDCKITKSQCNAGSGSWTTGCGCDHAGDPGFAGDCDHNRSEFGCYNANGEHQCDCSATEPACLAAQGSWITGCSCALDALPPPAPAPPPLPMNGGTVTVKLHAECPASTYLETFVAKGVVSSVASLSAVATNFISLGVADQCDTPRGAKGAAFAALTLTVSCATTSHVVFVEGALTKALVDAPSASFLLAINVFDKPQIIVECDACGFARSVHIWSILGALVGLFIVGGGVFLITRKCYMRGGATSTVSLLGGNDGFTHTSTSPYTNAASIPAARPEASSM